VKILVVDDHALVREGLRQVLKILDENVEVLETENCAGAFELAQQHPDIDLILLDYHLPDMNGLEALDTLGRKHPELPVLVLSGSANQQIAQQVLRSGASGYINKSGASEELIHAIERVLNGDIYHPEDLLTQPGSQHEGKVDVKPPLTKRQERVLRGLIDGLPNRDISAQLHVSEQTVKTHVAAILRYFDAQNRTQAVVAAARSGYRI